MLLRTSLKTCSRRGISLTEILIGILVLGIGVISLATLFPLGLLRMRRAVNDVRGTITARTAWNEVKIRNLVAPPFGPPAVFYSGYPNPWPPPPFTDLDSVPIVPTGGPGVPVIIDPLWMIQARPGAYTDPFGLVDMDGNGTPDFPGGEGLLRVRGGAFPFIGPLLPFPRQLVFEVFSSPDDITFRQTDRQTMPLQDLRAGPPAASPFFLQTNGVPFRQGTLLREARYSWLVIARKVNTLQGLGPGPNGVPGNLGDDDGARGADDVFELGWPGTDDFPLTSLGPDGVRAMPGDPTADDPARDMVSGRPVPGPVGPFDVTVVVFYKRDFSSREPVYANDVDLVDNFTLFPGQDELPDPIFRRGLNVASLIQRPGVPFPEIPLNSYIMDTTFDTSPLVNPDEPKFRNGYIYRVTGKSQTLDLIIGTQVLTLTLDQPARANGHVLTVLRDAVGVFEKQVP